MRAERFPPTVDSIKSTSESEVAEHYSKLPRILGWLPSGLIIYWLLLGDYSDPHQSRP